MKLPDIVHALILCLITVALIACYFINLNKLNSELKKDFNVPFANTEAIELRSGPIWFYYDRNKQTLSATKPISKEDKFTLLTLYPQDKVISPSYASSIDELAFISNKEVSNIFYLILTLGSIGGALGTMIRSLSSMVYHACIQKDLDMDAWWHWYYLRPIMGVGLGVTIVVLSKTSLLNINSPGELTGFWVLGICILAGFAVQEVTDRFYYTAKSLFGGDGK